MPSDSMGMKRNRRAKRRRARKPQRKEIGLGWYLMLVIALGSLSRDVVARDCQTLARGWRFTLLTWPRAALSALVGCIALFAGCEHNIFWFGWKLSGPAIAEISPPPDLKNISILNPSIKIDATGASADIPNLVGSQLTTKPNEFRGKAVHTQACCKFIFQSWYSKQTFLIRGLNYRNLTPTNDIFGGRLSTVSPCHSDPGFIGMFWKLGIHHGSLEQTCAVQVNVGSQLSASIGDHDADGDNKCEELEKGGGARNASDLVTQAPAAEPTIVPLLVSLVAVCAGFSLGVFGLLNSRQ